MVELDTALTEAKLRGRYAAGATDSEVRLSHILLAWPPESAPGGGDSGYFGPREKIVQVEAAAFTVEPGTVS